MAISAFILTYCHICLFLYSKGCQVYTRGVQHTLPYIFFLHKIVNYFLYKLGWFLLVFILLYYTNLK